FCLVQILYVGRDWPNLLMDMEGLTPTASLASVVSCLLLALILILTAVYRLFFHPLASFPGPRVAAITILYEAYYDVWKGGKYIFEVDKLHRRYGELLLYPCWILFVNWHYTRIKLITPILLGPIVRISPNELHVNDPNFYDTLYSPEGRWEKSGFTYKPFAFGAFAFTALNHDEHQQRRQPWNSFFTKTAVNSLEARITTQIDKLSSRIEEFASSGKILPISVAYSAMTMDIITEYALGRSYGLLDHEAFNEALVTCDFRIQELNEKIRSDKLDAKTERIIFHDFKTTDKLPLSGRTDRALIRQLEGLLGAGTEPTAHVLRIVTYYLCQNPTMLQTLRTELKGITRSSNTIPKLVELEKLPYLTALVQEGLRLSYGVAARMPRIAPDRTLEYRGWKIPSGTAVSMTHSSLYHDEDIFPDSYSFMPERFLDPVQSEASELCFAPFGRGKRSCLGKHLAYAELYLTIATLFSRFNFQLYDTSVENIQLGSDGYMPVMKKPHGVRVTVKKVKAPTRPLAQTAMVFKRGWQEASNALLEMEPVKSQACAMENISEKVLTISDRLFIGTAFPSAITLLFNHLLSLKYVAMFKRKRIPCSVGADPYPTPPSSIRSRQGSSTGISSTSGEFVDITSEFRIGAPRPLLFLPLLMYPPIPSTSAIPYKGKTYNWALLVPSIVETLGQNNVGWQSVNICHRRPTPEPPGHEDLTILIVSQKCKGWLVVLERLRELLVVNGLADLQIEIIDPLLHNGPTFSTVPADGELQASWRLVIYPQIQARLQHSNWLTFGLIRRGFSQDTSEHPITISITIPVDNIDNDWPEKMEDIRDVCKDAGYPDMEVDVGHGAVSRDVATGNPGEGTIPECNYDRELQMGSSISTENGAPGTFGGVIELFKDGQSLGLHGLTCHHVVGSDKGPEVIEHSQDVHGRRIFSPAIDHHKRSQAALRERIALANTLDHEMGLVKANQDILEFHENVFEERGACGSVRAASGEGYKVLYKDTSSRRDWALLQVNEIRTPAANYLPTGNQVPGEFHVIFRPDHRQGICYGSVGCTVKDGEDEDAVFKIGQRTGFTQATRNNYDWNLRFDHEPKHFAGTAEMTFFYPKVYSAKGGDSGAFVFDSRGRWMGMSFARVWRGDYSVGFVQKSTDITRDIKRVTGCDDVRLPEPAT
ncbi:MAG: hypothetical protein Q9224_002960, partial [Gallowayella concinna]